MHKGKTKCQLTKHMDKVTYINSIKPVRNQRSLHRDMSSTIDVFVGKTFMKIGMPVECNVKLTAIKKKKKVAGKITCAMRTSSIANPSFILNFRHPISNR